MLKAHANVDFPKFDTGLTNSTMEMFAFCWILVLPLLCSHGAPVYRRSTPNDIPTLQDIKVGVAVFKSVIDSIVCYRNIHKNKMLLNISVIYIRCIHVYFIYCLFPLIQYLPGLSDALVEAIQMFCTVVKDLNSQKFIASEADNSSDVISVVSSELKKYGCKWVPNCFWAAS